MRMSSKLSMIANKTGLLFVISMVLANFLFVANVNAIEVEYTLGNTTKVFNADRIFRPFPEEMGERIRFGKQQGMADAKFEKMVEDYTALLTDAMNKSPTFREKIIELSNRDIDYEAIAKAGFAWNNEVTVLMVDSATNRGYVPFDAVTAAIPTEAGNEAGVRPSIAITSGPGSAAPSVLSIRKKIVDDYVRNIGNVSQNNTDTNPSRALQTQREKVSLALKNAYHEYGHAAANSLGLTAPSKSAGYPAISQNLDELENMDWAPSPRPFSENQITREIMQSLPWMEPTFTYSGDTYADMVQDVRDAENGEAVYDEWNASLLQYNINNTPNGQNPTVYHENETKRRRGCDG